MKRQLLKPLIQIGDQLQPNICPPGNSRGRHQTLALRNLYQEWEENNKKVRRKTTPIDQLIL